MVVHISITPKQVDKTLEVILLATFYLEQEDIRVYLYHTCVDSSLVLLAYFNFPQLLMLANTIYHFARDEQGK